MKKIITLCMAAILILSLAACTDNIEKSYDDSNNPVSEQNYDVGEPTVEGCYDDPDNPAARQNYSVGEPFFDDDQNQ